MAEALSSNRVAKVAIGLDIRALKTQKEALKREIADIGKTKIDPAASKSISGIVGKDALKQAQELKKSIGDIGKSLKQAGQSTGTAFDPARVRMMTRELARLNQELRQYNALSGQGNGPSGGGGGGGGTKTPSGTGGASEGTSARRGSGTISAIRGLAATVGMGMGVSWGVGRGIEQARGRMGIREFVGGTVYGGSKYGFTREERVARGQSIARESGRYMSNKEIGGITNQSEMMQRAYGISGDEYGRSFGAARRAGIGNESGFIHGAVSDAGKLGLGGAKVGEYLEAMTGYLESVSKGIDVNDKSLRGFATSLGQLDFFKADPARIFEAIKTLEQTFQNPSSPYQQFASYQAIQGASMSANGRQLSPAGVEVRRNIGLFGEDPKLAKMFRGAGMGDLSDVFSTGGGAIGKNMLEDMYKQSMGASGGNNQAAMQMFMEASGLKNKAGASIFAGMATNGGRMRSSDMKTAQKAMMSPEERAQANMNNADANTLKLGQRIDAFKDAVSDFIMKGVNAFIKIVDKLEKMFGLVDKNFAAVGAAAAALGSVAAILTSIGGVLGIGAGVMSVVGAGVAGGAGALAGAAIGGAGIWAADKYSPGWQENIMNMGNPAAQRKTKARREHNAIIKKFGQKAYDKAAGDVNSTVGGPNADAAFSGKALDAEVESSLSYQNSGKNMDMGEYYNKEKSRMLSAINMVDEVKQFMDKKKAFADLSPEAQNLAKAIKSGGITTRNQWEEDMGDYKKMGPPKAAGGAIGTDTIMTPTTPGEFVVNARDSSRNMSALAYANAGGTVKPDFGQFPSSVGLDSGMIEDALSGNTKAIRSLTMVLMGNVTRTQNPVQRETPRGPGNVRYGRS